MIQHIVHNDGGNDNGATMNSGLGKLILGGLISLACWGSLKAEVWMERREGVFRYTRVGLDRLILCGVLDKTLENYVIRAEVTDIDVGAFKDCNALATVQFQEGSRLKRIGRRAFAWTPLRRIEIPRSV
jgi:hypothetical protein